MTEQVIFPEASAALLEPYLPPQPLATKGWPFVTLTFATSLDSQLSLAPGVRTRLSGPASKAMTHYLRSRHAAILIGVSTLLADDPGLNCKIAGVSEQPRPVIVDPHTRWTPKESDKVLQLAKGGQGLAPFVLTGVPEAEWPQASVKLLKTYGGKFIHIEPYKTTDKGRSRFDWTDIIQELRSEGLFSVMVEGGGHIINSFLSPEYHDVVDSVLVTITPTWLGQGGVVVSPERVEGDEGVPIPVARLSNVKWHPFGEDVVLCGKLNAEPENGEGAEEAFDSEEE